MNIVRAAKKDLRDNDFTLVKSHLVNNERMYTCRDSGVQCGFVNLRRFPCCIKIWF